MSVHQQEWSDGTTTVIIGAKHGTLWIIGSRDGTVPSREQSGEIGRALLHYEEHGRLPDAEGGGDDL